MTLGGYIKDKILIVLLNVLGAFFLSLYLLVVGNSTATVSLIIIVWTVIYLSVFIFDYQKRKIYFDKVDGLMDSLSQPYLIHELMESSWRLEDQLYHKILSRSNKAVIEQIEQICEEQKEYRDFLEGWIHEAKLPITGMRLVCHDDRNNDSRRMALYLTEMDNIIEKVLFYAKSEQLYKDFQVRETNLKKVIYRIVNKNKYLLIQNQMNVQVELEDCIVYSDKKWLEFIFMQIIVNAVKYKKADSGKITFSLQEKDNGIKLIIRDNGMGINDNELGRIFDKGFTGSNGREREKSTGIGLYLCKKLCYKLEVSIGAESIVGEYTEIHIVFPKNSYLTKL